MRRGEQCLWVIVILLISSLLLILLIPKVRFYLQDFTVGRFSSVQVVAKPLAVTTLAKPRNRRARGFALAANPYGSNPRHPLRFKTIFVSLPAYRDPEIPFTVVSAFERAQFPNRISLGVCEQWGGDDSPVRQAAVALMQERNPRLVGALKRALRVHRMPASDARGPILARWIIEQKLYKDEDFLLMSDSHAQFAPGWDSYLLDEHQAAPAHPAVLTTYPETYSRSDRDGAVFYEPTCHVTFKRFEEGSRFPLWGTKDIPRDAPYPPFVMGWCAGCAFAPREVVRAVPFHHGPSFPHLFFGEEVGMAIRLFTNGVHVFAPRRDALLTIYERDYRPLFWNEVPDKEGIEEASRARMRRVLGMERDHPGLFGHGALGTTRTLEQFKQYSGMDLRKQEVQPHGFAGKPDLRVIGWTEERAVASSATRQLASRRSAPA